MSFRSQATDAQLAALIGAAVPIPPSAADIGAAVGASVPVPPTAGSIGAAVGAAVPVPPTAGSIGAAVGAAVPVPPSAAAIGAAVPVPPSAAAIGAAVPSAAAIGAAVPVPPSAAAIGAAVPVPPSAAAIGAAVPVPPSAAAIGAAVPVPPSAAAVGGQVASQANAMGIPGVGKFTDIFSGNLAANGSPGASTTVDITAFSAVAVIGNGPFTVLLADLHGNTIYVEDFGVSFPAIISTEAAARLTITNKDAANAHVYTVSGGNIQTIGRTDSRTRYSGVAVFQAASQAWAVGATPTLTNGGANPVALQGPQYARFALSSGTALRGYWAALDVLGVSMVLCDTVECVAGATGFAASKIVALPAHTQSLVFTVTTAGTATIGARMVSMLL